MTQIIERPPMYGDDVPEDQRATVQDGVEVGVHSFNRLRENLESHHETAPAIDHFLTLLATCHTVIPERDDTKGTIKYQAASPDEGALVDGALELGYKFMARKPRSVMIEVAGQQLEYELLAVCEFNSTRKRMSTIYRCPDGRIRCYCKGADTVILERLQRDVNGGNNANPHVDATLRHLEDYAAEGLRTLCLAMREVPEDEFREWWAVYDAAQTTVGGNRADELDKAAELIERDFFLLGATAIEDRLQDGVPETIHTLQQAGIKVWVLTGDRQETAINIGMSCKLLSEDMMLLIVNEETADATRENLQKKLDAIRAQGDGTMENETLALVIDGKSLTYALERDLEGLFLDLAVMCKAVVCCRVSPLQKALVVKLVKKFKKESITLAIGDGANDVSMIQAAHIGVGISGLEGMQAARSADVAIGQFRFLRKLLLVHGAWSYHRVTKTTLFSFYKNITLYMTQFWVGFFFFFFFFCRPSSIPGLPLTLFSTPFKTCFRAKSSSSRGRFRFTTCFTRFCRRWPWACLSSSSRRGCWIDTPSCTRWASRTGSFASGNFSAGSATRSTTRSSSLWCRS